ncbi:hypothetical protein [Flavobacterium caeni]|uniref:Uncharacterized protein n=1 Tax=Flavobacterium caeni TaxID=490189 RepID=A0A1G5JKN1_9FLAO|nr:hypothetical protein [Flavobacterium caeni]SCY88886.1 hypothetical protein SAMN02927903_02768 [Flavobacterium caeni]
MSKLKFLAVLLIAFALQSQAQTYKFMTTGFSVMEKDANGNWGKWSDLQPASIVVTLDTNKNRIVVYSQEIQLYNIVNYEDEEENENDLIYTFSCADENGMPFTISIITRKKQDNRKQLYINQKDVIVVYNIVNFIDKDEK